MDKSIIKSNNIALAEFEGLTFQAFRGRSFYEKSFNSYKDCEKWIKNNKNKEISENYTPQVGYNLGVGNYDKDWNALIGVYSKISTLVMEIYTYGDCIGFTSNCKARINRYVKENNPIKMSGVCVELLNWCNENK